jgi:hypothetical protein
VARRPLWWPPRPRLAARRPEPAARSSRRRRPRPVAPVQLHARGCLLLFAFRQNCLDHISQVLDFWRLPLRCMSGHRLSRKHRPFINIIKRS